MRITAKAHSPVFSLFSTLFICSALLISLSGWGTVPALQAHPLPVSGVSPGQVADTGGNASTYGSNFLVSTAGMSPRSAAVAHNTSIGSDEFLVVYVRDTPGNLYGQIYTMQGLPVGETFLISDATNHQYEPAVAYNPAVSEYLVVWTDSRLGTNRDIRGRRIDADGTLLGAEFSVSDDLDNQSQPSIAYNSVTSEYLVAWTDNRDSDVYGQDVYGRRVHYDGTLGGDVLRLSSTHGDEVAPEAVFNVQDQEYLVVWEHQISGQSDIRGQMLQLDGSTKGTDHLINPYTEDDQRVPTVAWDGANNLYLVVWEDHRNVNGGGAHLYGSVIHDDWSLIAGYMVFDVPGDQLHPNIVYNRDAQEYLVVWDDGRDTTTAGTDLYGLRLYAAPVPRHRPQGDFLIAQAAFDQSNPVAVYSRSSKQYVVIWEDLRDAGSTAPSPGTLYAQRVWWPGLLLGDDFILDAAAGSQERPAVAYSALNHEYMLVWVDERDGTADIFGRLYDDDGLPLTETLVVQAAPGDQVSPSVAFNPNQNSYLVVWEDRVRGTIEGRLLGFRGSPLTSSFTVAGGDTWNTSPAIACNTFATYNDYLVVFEGSDTDKNIYSRRVTAAGIATGGSILISGGNGQQSNPDLVFNPESEEFLVVWQDTRYEDNDIYAQRVGPTQILLDYPIQVAQHPGSDEHTPTVAHNPIDNEYLVAWRETRPGETAVSIKARRLAEFGMWLGDIFWVTPDGNQQYNPDAVFVGNPGRYRVVWEDNRNSGINPDIYGQWIARDGTPVSSSGDPIIRYAAWQLYPAVVYGVHRSTGTPQVMTVWQDGRSGVDTDIYAQISPVDITPPVARFTRNPTRTRPGMPFEFNAYPSYDNATRRGLLQVRWDLDNNGEWDTELGAQKFITHTFAATGVHTVTLLVQDNAQFTDTISLPVFVQSTLPATDSVPQLIAATHPTASLNLTSTLFVAGESILMDASESLGTGSIAVRWDWENDGVFDTPFSAVLTTTHSYTMSGVHTARVEALDNTGFTDATLHNVTVLPGAPALIEPQPISVWLVPKTSVQMGATAWDIYQNRMQHPATTWTLALDSLGSIDAGGLLTASVRAGNYPGAIIGTSGAVSGTTMLTIFWPCQVYLPLSLRD